MKGRWVSLPREEMFGRLAARSPQTRPADGEDHQQHAWPAIVSYVHGLFRHPQKGIGPRWPYPQTRLRLDGSTASLVGCLLTNGLRSCRPAETGGGADRYQQRWRLLFNQQIAWRLISRRTRVKPSRLSHWQVSSPRLLRLTCGVAVESQTSEQPMKCIPIETSAESAGMAIQIHQHRKAAGAMRTVVRRGHQRRHKPSLFIELNGDGFHYMEEEVGCRHIAKDGDWRYCFMFVDPPEGAKEAALKAIRRSHS